MIAIVNHHLGASRAFIKTHSVRFMMAVSAVTALVGVLIPEATTVIALGFFAQTLIAEA